MDADPINVIFESVMKRLDSHGADLKELNKGINDTHKMMSSFNAEIKQILSNDKLENERRLTKLESERGFVGKLVNLIVALFGGTIAGWLTHK
jgi:uncharacterized protein YwgA